MRKRWREKEWYRMTEIDIVLQTKRQRKCGPN